MNRIGTKTIETDRLILRRFTLADAEAMYANWASDPEVTKYLTWPPHASVADSRMILSDWIGHYEEGDFFQWAIELKEIGQPIGSIGVVSSDERIGEAEVGYCIGMAYRGRGIMPEALRAVRDFLFDEVGAARIAAKHDAENPNSGRVMAKAGMLCEGTCRRAGYNNRGIIDIVLYAMLASDRK